MSTPKPVQSDSVQHIPWNKNRLIGQKKPLKLREIWAIRIRLQLLNKSVTLRSSILRLTVNYEVAIWSLSGFWTLPKVKKQSPGQ
jgi:hypothetical protein